MSARPTSVFAGLVCLAFAPGAAAQTTIATTPGGAPVALEALGGGDPFAAAAAAAAAGTPGPASVFTTNVGFSYLRPYWAANGLNLRTQIGNNPAVAVINPFGDLANGFGFVPRVDLQYDASALGFGLAASAQFLGLGGSLERTVSVNGTAADLTATSDLTFVIVNLTEITKTVRGADLSDSPLLCELGLADDTYGFTIGTRFTSVRQAWNAALRSGTAALASADATQNFAGLGLTTAFSADHPCGERWGLYSNLRWSFLVGPNNRKSVVTGLDADGPFTNSLVENKTTWIPAGELEVGVRYLTPLDSGRAATDRVGSMLSVRVGVVGQYWGGLGFLPAAPRTAEFDNRALFLVGFTLLAGIEF